MSKTLSSSLLCCLLAIGSLSFACDATDDAAALMNGLQGGEQTLIVGLVPVDIAESGALISVDTTERDAHGSHTASDLRIDLANAGVGELVDLAKLTYHIDASEDLGSLSGSHRLLSQGAESGRYGGGEDGRFGRLSSSMSQFGERRPGLV